MKAVLITYDGERIVQKDIVEISDDFQFGVDDVYGDKVPFSVGSNQTIVPFDWNEERREFADDMAELKEFAYQNADENDLDDVKHTRWCALGDLMYMPKFRQAILLAAKYDTEIAEYLKEKNILPYLMDNETPVYTDTEYRFKVVEMMERHGGSFAKSLAKSWMLADSDNRQRIEDAFDELFQTYRNMIAMQAVGDFI